jgi:hypothetical protein
MKPRGPLTDEQTRARLLELEQEDARLTREIDARTAKRARLRAEAAALNEPLPGQLELPLASTRPVASPRGQRAA